MRASVAFFMVFPSLRFDGQHQLQHLFLLAMPGLRLCKRSSIPKNRSISLAVVLGLLRLALLNKRFCHR